MQQLLDTLLNGPSRYTQQQNMGPGMTLLVVLGALMLEFIAVYIIVRLFFKAVQNVKPFVGFVLRLCGVGEKNIDYSFLELTFPADTSKSAFATEQLHILLRSLVKYRGTLDHLAARKKPYSLELVATRDDGIRYILSLPTWADSNVQRTLRSFLPGLKVRVVDDYLNDITNSSVGVVELRLAADFVLPLKDHTVLTEHDPIAYLSGHMTKLSKDEVVAFQVVTVPVFPSTHTKVMRRIRHMQNRIAMGQEVTSQLATQYSASAYGLRLFWYPPVWIITVCLKVIVGIFEILTAMFSKEHNLPSFMNPSKDKKPTDNPYELELGKSIKAKLDQPLFEVSLRVLVASRSAEVIENRLEALVDSFRQFSNSSQAITLRRSVPVLSPDKKLLPRFKARALSPHLIDQPTIVSSAELSDLYHFPETDLTKTEGLVKSRSRELPAPLSIKHSNNRMDVVIGVNQHGGDSQPIGMTLEQRQKHTYIIGKTGTGKTTLLTSSIYQDMVSGKGLAVLDPHGDMFQELLGIIPEDRKQDVIVFDPSDRDYPLGLNLLDPGIDFASDDDRYEWITSSVLSVFAKLADEHQWGPRMEHILRSTTLTALQLPNPSLYTIQRLLTDKKYQKQVAAGLKDPVLKQFWDKEFKLLGTMQLSSATAPLTHRLGHFLTTKMSRHILLQERSSLRIADIMNDGKILLVNLSKGDIGEDQSFFFGTILTSFIWMAAYQRTKIPEKQRRDFFVYIDEFQNFATRQFADITSEGRKFHVSLIVSHQNIAQIEDQSILKVMVGNASTLICLKASPEDEAFILPYMKPEVEKGDIVNLAPYHLYIKTTSDESEDAFSGQTVPLDVAENDKIKQAVVAYSRKRYGTPKARVEEYMEQLFVPQVAVASKRINTSRKATKNLTLTNAVEAGKVHGI